MKTLLNCLLFLTLASLPSYLVRCKNFSWCPSPIPFTLLEVLILATVLTWFLIRLKETRSVRRVFENVLTKIDSKFKFLALIFLTSAALGVLVSPDKLSALGIFKAYFVEPALLSIVVFDYLVRSKKLDFIVLPLLLGTAVVSGVAVVEKVLGVNPGNPVEFLERGRVSAFYSTSNAVALLIGPVFYLSVAKFLFAKEKARKITFLFLVILLLGGLVVSGSRAGMFAVGVGGLTFGTLLLIKRIKKDFLVILARISPVLLASGLLINLLFLLNINHFMAINIEKNILPSMNQRLCLWEAGTGMVSDKFLLGAGLSGYPSLAASYRTCNLEELQYPHTVVLNFWLETGIFGLVSLSLLLAIVIKELLESKTATYFNFALVSGFVVVMVHGLLDVPYFKNDLSTQFWVLLALSLYLVSVRESRQ